MAQIYAACLASYNSGVLHGRWIEVDDVDSMEAEIAEMLRKSPYPNVTVRCPECEGRKSRLVASCVSPDREPCPECNGEGIVPSAEEYAVHDYDDLPANHFGEHPNLAELVEYVALVDKHGDAFEAFFEELNYSGMDLESEFQNRYRGSYATKDELADEYIMESMNVPDELLHYIDASKVLYELEMDFSIVYHGGRYHVFWNN